MLYLTCTTITSVDLAHYGVSRAKDWLSVDCGTIQIKVVKILQELAESEPKAHPIHHRERRDKHIITNNRIADDKLQLFPKQVATQLPFLD